MSDDKKQVAILSMQQIDNFGSLLQAYSLKKILESINCEVSFLDIEIREEDNKLVCGSEKKYDSEIGSKSILNKLFDKYVFIRIRNKTKRIKQSEVYEKFRQKYFLKNTNGNKFDLCVIGSDEVFNCLQDSFWGFTSQLFGNVKEADKVITYAACCGFTEYECLPEKVIEKIKESFKKISTFSVRDSNTFEFVHKLAGDKNIEINFDPALLGNFDKEIEIQKKVNKLPEHYCLVYAYTNRIYREKDIRYIKSFCKKRGLDIIAVGTPQKWIKKFYVASPFELLHIFKNADFVITDTFHGTVFSAKYASRFAILVRDSNRNKLADLIYRIKLDNHKIDSVTELDRVANTVHDKNAFQELIINEYNRSLEYLRRFV